MKKKLNVDSIRSELTGGSAFFPGYKGTDFPVPSTSGNTNIAHTKTVEQSSPSRNHQPSSNIGRTDSDNKGVPLPVPRTVPRTGSRPLSLTPRTRRPIKQRQPFDIYEDQYLTLKEIADKERGFINGRSMSQMVRDAIDDYLRNNKPSTS